jgi:rare lipoprotein A
MKPPCLPTALLVCAALCGALPCAPTALAQAPAAGASLTADPGALAGKITRLRGTLPDVPAGGTIQIQRLDPAAGWVSAAATVAGAGGTFVARWRPRVIGRYTVRAVAAGSQVQAAAAAPTAPVTIYRAARATWYGPGLYGHTTACGEVLSHRIMGVAHRTLPCGTPVTLYLAGRTVVVPVIDRGPFSNGAHYDVTSAAAQQIGLTETTTIGVVPQRGATMLPPEAAPPPLAATAATVPGAGGTGA